MSGGSAIRRGPGGVLRAVLLAVALVSTTACGSQEPSIGWSFERMIRQPSFKAYEAAGVFADSMAMRQPPEGTVNREALVASAAVVTGRQGQGAAVRVAPDTASAFDRNLPPWVEEIPVRLTREDLERGRERFRIFCAVCHGLDGSSGTPVARNMTLRSPPSLHEEDLRRAPAGRIFGAITNGYGFMPSYAAELPVRDRWAVVGYVRALQLARRASLAELPDSVQRAFREAAGPPPAPARPDTSGEAP